MSSGESRELPEKKSRIPESDDLVPSRGRDNHGSWIAWSVVCVIVLYVLSPGPLTWMEKVGWLPNNSTSWLRMVYFPLMVLYESFPPVKQFYDWWLSIFE